MKTRRLGTTDLELSVVGFGAWALGGADWEYGWGAQDDAESVEAILKAVEVGVNWVDTAAVYGLGHSEEVVGRALKKLWKKPMIATKCGLVWDENGKISGRLKKESVRAELEASLKRLGVERIDLYQVHWPNPDADISEAWGALSELVEQGKIRHIGVSNFTTAQIERVLPIHPVASIQPHYSMITREIEAGLLPFCAERGIGVVVYSPMEAGLLTGKFTAERVAALPDDDWRKTKNPHFKEPELSANLEFVEGLRKIAESSGRTPAQLAVAWTLRRPELTAAIVGSRRPSQIAELAPAGDWELSEGELAAVDALLGVRSAAGSAK